MLSRFSRLSRLLPPLPALVWLGVALLLAFPALFPPFEQLSLSEAAALNAARQFVETGALPRLAESPLPALFYAPAVAPFTASVDWLAQSAALGRILAYLLLCVSVYQLARQLWRIARPAALLGMFLVAPLGVALLSQPAELLFAAFAGLAIARLLEWAEQGGVANLWLASGFLGLASLAHLDGWLLFLFFLIAALVVARREAAAGRALLPALMPFIAVLGLFYLLRALLGGDMGSGLLSATYTAFESGQVVAYDGAGQLNALSEARLAARQLFGAPEDNAWLAPAAMLRNPTALLTRLGGMFAGLPGAAADAYDPRFVLPILLLALRGGLELAQKRRLTSLAILLLCLLPLVSSLAVTLFRPAHLQMAFYAIFSLAAVGLSAMLDELENRREMALWVLLLAVATAAGYILNAPAVAYSALVLLAALGILLFLRHILGEPYSPAAALLVLFAAGVILRGGFPPPQTAVIGNSPPERTAGFLANHLPPGSRALAATPAIAWAARLEAVPLEFPVVPVFETSQQWLVWLQTNDIRAVVVDEAFREENPAVWSLLKPLVGKELQPAFISGEGDLQALLVISP